LSDASAERAAPPGPVPEPHEASTRGTSAQHERPSVRRGGRFTAKI